MAVGDLDNDGSLEVIVNNMCARPSLLKNFGPRKNWLMVACAARSDPDAIGDRARVQIGKRWLHGEVQGGASYLSQSDPRLHFGLGGDSTYEAMEVRWPTGERERFPGGSANRLAVLKQGAGNRNGKGTEKIVLPAAAFFCLLINSAYLASFASPSLFYFSNLTLHVALGVALAIAWPRVAPERAVTSSKHRRPRPRFSRRD